MPRQQTRPKFRTGGPISWVDVLFDFRSHDLPLPESLPAPDPERSSSGHGWTLHAWAVPKDPATRRGRADSLVIVTNPDGVRVGLMVTGTSQAVSPAALGRYAPLFESLLRKDNTGQPCDSLANEDPSPVLALFRSWFRAALDPVGWLDDPTITQVDEIDEVLVSGLCRWASSGVSRRDLPVEFLRLGLSHWVTRDWMSAGFEAREVMLWSRAHSRFSGKYRVGPEMAALYRDTGVSPDDAGQWVDLSIDWFEEYPQWLQDWVTSGWTPQDLEQFAERWYRDWDRRVPVNPVEDMLLESRHVLLSWAQVSAEVAHDAQTRGLGLNEAIRRDVEHRAAQTPAAVARLADLKTACTSALGLVSVGAETTATNVETDRLSDLLSGLLDALTVCVQDVAVDSASHRAITHALGMHR